MAGKIKIMLDDIIYQKSKGNSTIATVVKTKIILKGIMVDTYTETSIDDPIIINRVKNIADEFGIYIEF